MELSKLTTEKRNQQSMNLDQMSTLEILKTINTEDKKIAGAVELVLPQIDIAVEQAYKALAGGGRLFYIGAGTSGRLGVIDASECPPTFMTPPEMVQTVMAGGSDAFFNAVEGSEDNEVQGAADLKEHHFTAKDVAIGITASGRTPYPIGALKYAQEMGAYTISLSCNENALISAYAACAIEVLVGPEVLTGSTRMKAATSHKMILNMISTTAMIKLGKVYENLMVDVHASNYKLKERAKHTLMEVTKVSYEEAERILHLTNYEVKPAIVMLEASVNLHQAQVAIGLNKGYVRNAIRYLS
ncbi:N-acetylmuramic acid 6-phosphate etherase [Virgibacillus halotolerans]|uniref:N-acetylmuramic acid 6-phosphate etherase n=1 Tax=Virgibacillus halotolerans TaxID=1071053 RepID=UPI00196009D0|nr:N-acetylmuramic acid 6-phosphate etherase [Virgibacillus halotolerans]MBM7601909.1 N-acetylmuramic acid 6-phosphate etherase [Virgibacillus halotolerans]